MTETARTAEEDRLARLTDREVLAIWLSSNHHEPTKAQLFALAEIERRGLDVEA